MSEADVMRTVLDAALVGGWPLRYHTHDSRRSPEGFPDWVFVRWGRAVALELKGEGTPVQPEQEVWIELLDSVPGIDAAIIGPAELDLALQLLQP